MKCEPPPVFSAFPDLTYLGKLQTVRSTDAASSRLGVGFETLDRDLWDPGQAWPVLNALGVKWARVQTGWAKTERSPGCYEFGWLDHIVDSLLECGVTPWLSLSYGNPLYTPTEDPAAVGCPPLNSERARHAWTAYVAALCKHFSNRVTHFEIWNEPDLSLFWKTGPRAGDYMDLVRITSPVIRRCHPSAKVVAGAVAWGLTPWSIKFIEDCLELGLRDFADILTFHGYKSIPERHSAQEFAAIRRLLGKQEPPLPFWQGESGVQSKIEEKAKGVGPLTGLRASEGLQARMLLRRFLMELHNGCDMCSWFHMADFGHYAGCMETFHFGLIRKEDGSPKPSYFAMQTLATLLQDPMEPADGRTSCHMSVLGDANDPRATKVATWHANFIRNQIPVHAWWIPDSLEPEPVFVPAEMAFWMESGLTLNDPVLIEPVSQEVYSLTLELDRRTCAETWMSPDSEAEGIRTFRTVPAGNSPVFLTDRSLIGLRENSGAIPARST